MHVPDPNSCPHANLLARATTYADDYAAAHSIGTYEAAAGRRKRIVGFVLRNATASSLIGCGTCRACVDAAARRAGDEAALAAYSASRVSL